MDVIQFAAQNGFHPLVNIENVVMFLASKGGDVPYNILITNDAKIMRVSGLMLTFLSLLMQDLNVMNLSFPSVTLEDFPHLSGSLGAVLQDSYPSLVSNFDLLKIEPPVPVYYNQHYLGNFSRTPALGNTNSHPNALRIPGFIRDHYSSPLPGTWLVLYLTKDNSYLAHSYSVDGNIVSYDRFYIPEILQFVQSRKPDVSLSNQNKHTTLVLNSSLNTRPDKIVVTNDPELIYISRMILTYYNIYMENPNIDELAITIRNSYIPGKFRETVPIAKAAMWYTSLIPAKIKQSKTQERNTYFAPQELD